MQGANQNLQSIPDILAKIFEGDAPGQLLVLVIAVFFIAASIMAPILHAAAAAALRASPYFLKRMLQMLGDKVMELLMILALLALAEFPGLRKNRASTS